MVQQPQSAVVGSVVADALVAYTAYEDKNTQENYDAFQDKAVQAAKATSTLSTLVTALNKVLVTNAADLSNANTLASKVDSQQANVKDPAVSPI